MAAVYRLAGSSWASGPVQRAAVMAARLMPKAPNGAKSKVATPVQPISGEDGVWYPAARITASPGRFWDATQTANSGRATPISACTLKAGVTHWGVVSEKLRALKSSELVAAATAMPVTRGAITA